MFIIAVDFFLVGLWVMSRDSSLLVQQLLFLLLAYSELCTEVSICVSAIFYVIDFWVFV